MDVLDRIFRVAKKAVIKSEKGDIEEKIIRRLSSISENDKKLLDNGFMNYLKNNNSRLYLFSESLKNNPEKFALLGIGMLVFIGFVFLIARSISAGNNARKTTPKKLPSPEDKS